MKQGSEVENEFMSIEDWMLFQADEFLPADSRDHVVAVISQTKDAGHYAVKSFTDPERVYETEIRIENGTLYGRCSCPKFAESLPKRPCRHILAAIAYHEASMGSKHGD